MYVQREKERENKIELSNKIQIALIIAADNNIYYIHKHRLQKFRLKISIYIYIYSKKPIEQEKRYNIFIYIYACARDQTGIYIYFSQCVYMYILDFFAQNLKFIYIIYFKILCSLYFLVIYKSD